jgi:hypothetical protein
MKEYYNNSTIGFSSQAPTSYQRESSFLFIHKWVMISRKGAHGIFKEGTTSVEDRAAKCGRVGCHLSTLIYKCPNKSQRRRVCHLLRVSAATSPRGAHLLNHMC